MTKYETDFTTGAYDLPTPSEVAAAERAYARETRRLGASIAAWEGENAESEWMYLDADMCEGHADIVEDPSRADSYEAYMHIVEEYQAMLDDGAPASGIILYLPHKYIEQLNERRREMVKENEKNLSREEQFSLYEEAANETGLQKYKDAKSVARDILYNEKSGKLQLQEKAQQALEDYKGQLSSIGELSQDVSTLLDEDTMLENEERDEIEAV